MSIFSAAAAVARTAHGAYFGRLVTVTEPGKAAYETKAVVGKITTETRQSGTTQERVSIRSCRFVSVETLRHDAIVTIDGDRYAIDQTIGREAGGLKVQLKRCVAHEVARPSYRGKG